MKTGKTKSQHEGKIQQKSKKETEVDEDRISRLPDVILHKILSLIDIQLAIQTCILSRRWKHLWTSLPYLNFDFQRYKYGTDAWGWVSGPSVDKALDRFTHFVNQVLSRRDSNSSICEFRLFFDDRVDKLFSENCVHYAISHNVQELEIAIYHSPEPFEFPQSFFTCQSLQKLRLKYYMKSMLIPKSFSLLNLKTLYLDRFPFGDDDPFSFSKDPFSIFPNLEKLTLHCCDVNGLIIHAPKLRTLELSFRGYNPEFSSESVIENISAPRLTSFKFEGHVSLICPQANLPCLEEVYVDLYSNLESPYTDDVKKRMPLNLIKMLEQLKNAKSVTLSLASIEVLAMDSSCLEKHHSPFSSLKHLKLTKAGRYQAIVPPENVITYFTSKSSYGDQIVVKFPKGMESQLSDQGISEF